MRAAQGAAHEKGGYHISGAERLVKQAQVALLVQQMVERAFYHARGQADFINITIENIPFEEVQQVELLPISLIQAQDVTTGQEAARQALILAGVAAEAAQKGIEQLLALPDAMRGAMLVCAMTGERKDCTEMRGIRVSRMDNSDEAIFVQWLNQQGMDNQHVREAMILAAKVAAAKGVVAELCWSDDPDYTTGYVASKLGYTRITHMKKKGSLQGGRLFFIHADCDIAELAAYLEQQPVLVNIPKRRSGDGVSK
jgi:6-carboxyhexanoate--CoA ligase